MKNKEYTKKLVQLTALVIFNAFANAICLKAAIGVNAYNALSQTLADLFNMKVGTMGILMNVTLVFGQWLILRKKFRFRHILQIPVSLLLGVVVNIVLYNMLNFEIESYIVRVILLLVGYVLLSFFTGAIMALDVVTFPGEGFCMAFAQCFGKDFGKLRLGFDVVCMALSVILSLIFRLPFAVREGTVIGIFMFAPLMTIFMKMTRKYLGVLGK